MREWQRVGNTVLLTLLSSAPPPGFVVLGLLWLSSMLPPCDRIGENITQQLVYTVTLWQSDAARCVMQQMIHSYNKRVCFTPTRTVKGGKVMCAYVSRVFTFAKQHVSLYLGQSVHPATMFVLQSPGGSGQRAIMLAGLPSVIVLLFSSFQQQHMLP